MVQAISETRYHLTDQLSRVRGVGEVLAAKLAKYDLHTIRDLLLFAPIQYEDLSSRVTIAQLQQNELVTVLATVESVSRYYKGGKAIVRAKISDQTGSLSCIWFNAGFIADSLVVGTHYFFSGKLSRNGGFSQPRFEKVSDDTIHTGRLVPKYSSKVGIVQGKLRHILKEICDHLDLQEPFEQLSITDIEALLPLAASLRQLHFPDTTETAVAAHERLALEELLSIMNQAHISRAAWRKLSGAIGIPSDEQIVEQCIETLPFTLTSAQSKAISEILTELQATTPMNRLLIGDVGSGKTVVAGIACALTTKAGQNAVLIAPTQILAGQHFAVLQKLFPNLPVLLITGKTKKSQRLADKPSIYIGTQAVFSSLKQIQPSLIIYDEQHRFGVAQRSNALGLQPTPHVLTMSATPIPRSIMLTLFAHLAVSVLDELPAGRLSPKTWLTPETKRADALLWMSKELVATQQQGLVICPYIDPSFAPAKENIAAATELFETYRKQLASIPEGKLLKLGLLHGRLSSSEKQLVIQQLYDHEIDLLIATPIVEVGVDLPSAAIMIIENAEQFGLASLHQLRGRVGRAGQQGYCLLFSKSHSPESKQRLQQFAQETSGFKLAELDLEHRGAGTLFGTQQHGFLNLQYANWTDRDRIMQAQRVYAAVQTEPNWQPFFPMTQTTVQMAAN